MKLDDNTHKNIDDTKKANSDVKVQLNDEKLNKLKYLNSKCIPSSSTKTNDENEETVSEYDNFEKLDYESVNRDVNTWRTIYVLNEVWTKNSTYRIILMNV